MKQGSFIVEFIVKDGDSVLYIVRALNGQIISICDGLESLCIYLDESEEKVLGNPNSNIKPINEDGKA